MTYEERVAFLEARKDFIGSSDAPAVCGLSPWLTPLHVYLSKVGQWESPDSDRMKWGRRLEEVVALAYAEETGRTVDRPKEATTRHHNFSHLGASVDFISTKPGNYGDVCILECKTSSQPDEWGTQGTDEVPDHYNIQVQHQMAVTGIDRAHIAVLINGSDFRVFCVDRNERLIAKILSIETDFWARVKDKNPPPPNWQHPGTIELMAHLYGCEETLTITLGREATELCHAYLAAREKQKDGLKEKQRAQAQLLEMIAQAGQAIVPGGFTIHRKAVNRKAYEMAESSYYSFRITEPKS